MAGDTGARLDQRWEDGVPHHPFSEAVVRAMAEIDREAGLPVDIEIGGDGDNGETMMFLLDEWVERNGGKCPCCGKK